jgi:hypothetical protein
MLGLSIAGPGCALVEDSSRNLFVAVSTPIEVHREKARNDRWAEAAWQTVVMKDGPCAHSEDFARGFKDGFAEYLFRGGDCEPPLIAPLHYRQYRFQTAKGYQAIQDWFAGYRSGATAARDSGARRWITSPSALQTELHEAPPHDVPVVMPSPLPPEQKEVIPLPLPKELPKELPAELPMDPAQAPGAPSRLGPAKINLEAPREEAPPTDDEPMMKAKVTAVRIALPSVPEPSELEKPQPELPVPPATDEEPMVKAKVTGARIAPPSVPEPPEPPRPQPPELPMPRIAEMPEVAPAAGVGELDNRDMLRARIQRIISGSPKD